MSRLSPILSLFLVALLCLQTPFVSSDWKPVQISPSTTLYFPPGGGTCTTALKLPRDGLVDDIKFNITGKPVLTNSTFTADANQLWNGSTERKNLTLGTEGIGLGEYGSWWEESAAEAWERAPPEDREGWRTVGENGSVLDNWTYDQDAGGLRLARDLEKAFVADAATVGLWHFDDGTGTDVNDSSGLGNDGKLMDDPKWTKGRFGTGLLFDGVNDFVEVADANSLSSPNKMTIECWFKTDAKDANVHSLVTKYNGQNAGSEYILYLADGGCRGQIISDTSYVYMDPSPLLLEGWHHFAMTYDGAVAKLFFDGEMVFAAAFNQFMANTNTPVRFGNIYPEIGFFQGILDEIRISNVARPISNAFFSDSASLISPVLNVSAYSRVMVQGDFPDGTNYTVDILDPKADNATLLEGLHNGACGFG